MPGSLNGLQNGDGSGRGRGLTRITHEIHGKHFGVRGLIIQLGFILISLDIVVVEWSVRLLSYRR